jgi:hypothetical protein
MNFNTTIPTIPASVNMADALTEPKGDILTNYTPTYQWKQVDMATWYLLEVSGPSGVVVNQWYTAGICPAGTCSVVSPTTVGGGNYSWRVRTWNSAGYGPWSAVTTFSTTIPTLPTAATNLSPSGTIASHTPTYTWNKVGMATWYRLYVNGPSGLVKDQWYQASTICNSITNVCTVGGSDSPTLESGAHT